MSVATGETAERAVFARKTSGLVKELGAFESFSINLISLGPGPAYGLFLIILLFVTGANLMQATLLAALAGIPVIVAYAILAIEMPRSGGEYVYASRLLHPYLGFVGGMSRILNVLIYAAILPYWFVVLSVGPGLASWGSVSGNAGIANLGASLSTNTTWILVIGEVLTVLVMLLWIGMKPRLAFRIFSALLILELAGLTVALGLLFVAGHTGFVNAVNSFMGNQGYAGNYYADVSAYGATWGPYGSSFTNTLIFVPLVFAFYYMFGGAPSYIAGEFRRTARSVGRGMAVSFILAVGFAAGIVYAFESIIGMDFLNGVVANSFYLVTGTGVPPPMPFAAGLTSLPNLVANGNSILLGLMFLGSVSWYALWLILGLYIFSRYALSFSLDRLFPRFMGSVTRRTHQPWAGIVVVSIVGIILLPLVTYFYTAIYYPFLFLLFFLPMVTVSLSSLSLVSLGVRKKRVAYEIVGALSFVVTVVSAYLVSTLPLLGNAAGFTLSNQDTSYITIIAVFVGSAIWYWGARGLHLRRQGIDIGIAFKELPPD
jgi:basic amino acid/polyamine antiporter, APA family